MSNELALLRESALTAKIPNEVSQTATFREKCREHWEDVISFWADTMTDADAALSNRIQCSKQLAAYGFGLPRQTISLQGAVVDPIEQEKLHRENRDAVARAMGAAMAGMGHNANEPSTDIELPRDYVHTMPGVDTSPEAVRRRDKAAVVAAAVTAALDAGNHETVINIVDESAKEKPADSDETAG